MASSIETIADNLIDTAIGAVWVNRSVAVGFDIDDFVSTTVKNTAISVKLYNLAGTVDTQLAQNRRIVSIGGATVGGF